MNEFLEECLFWTCAAVIAPSFFTPEDCPIRDKSKCRIWNCTYHYISNKYSDCLKGADIYETKR